MVLPMMASEPLARSMLRDLWRKWHEKMVARYAVPLSEEAARRAEGSGSGQACGNPSGRAE